MARRRRDSSGEERPEGREEGEAGNADEGAGKKPSRRKPKLGNPDADPVKIHREYVEQRLEGGSATPEVYEEALRQWQNIPGAVSRPPAEVPPIPDQPAEPQENEEREDDEDRGNESSS